jgi:hypothetical protein
MLTVSLEHMHGLCKKSSHGDQLMVLIKPGKNTDESKQCFLVKAEIKLIMSGTQTIDKL